jgi:hypothetical protein
MKYQAFLALLYSTTFGRRVAAHIANSSSFIQQASASSYWYENIQHNGQASYMRSDCKSSYQVFRNVVTDFGADNSGNTDASTAIQNAIDGKLLTQAFHVMSTKFSSLRDVKPQLLPRT